RFALPLAGVDGSLSVRREGAREGARLALGIFVLLLRLALLDQLFVLLGLGLEHALQDLITTHWVAFWRFRFLWRLRHVRDQSFACIRPRCLQTGGARPRVYARRSCAE